MFRVPILPGYLCILACAAAQNTIYTVAGGAPPVTPATAVKASVGDPPRVATDAAGNVYFGGVHSVFRVDAGGTLARIAGTGRAGYTGDGGPATGAQLMTPAGIAVDSAGNVYVADRDASVVRRIAGDGSISTVAGTGSAGYNGDGGPAGQAQLNMPMGLAADGSGNLYVADTENHRVRKIAGGVISTVAGNGSFGYGGDGGPATAAELNEPEGVALDTSGNIYIADTTNDRIRLVSGNGKIATVAGTGLSSVFGSIWDETGVSTTTGDNGPATSAAVVLPTDVAVDGAGNLYIADYGNARIRVVTKGVITTLAGSPDGIPPTDGQVAITTHLNGPTGLAVDSAGDVFLAEGSIATGSGLGTGDYRVWKVTPDGVLNAVAGDGLDNYSGDGAAAALAQLHGPAAVAVDGAGTVYIADSLNHRVRRVKADGRIDTVAGNGTAGMSGDGGPAASAQLNAPTGVAVDASGALYIADTGNDRVRKVTSDGTIRTIAGNGNASFYGDGLPATQASIHAPNGVAVAADGTVYIADTLNQRVRKIAADGTLQTVAGNGVAGFSGDGGAAAQASLNLPGAVALDGSGTVYVADRGNGRVRAISPKGIIGTVAGNGSSGSGGDGFAATAAPLLSPQGVAVDGSGNLYIAEAGRNTLRKVASDGTISTIAGTGGCCYSGDGGTAIAAALNAPAGVAVDANGNVYFADYGNDAVRAVGAAAAGPSLAAVTNGASNQLGPIAPGEVVVLYGTGLGPAQIAVASGATTQLAGVSVLFNGVAGQMLYAYAGQTSAIVPPGVGGTSVPVVVTSGNLSSNVATLTLAAAAPGLFTRDSSGVGQAQATNQNGTPNGAGAPAAAGSTITLVATGTGSLIPTATIGGLNAPVTSTSTLAPGVLSMAVQVPGGLAAGTAPVAIQAGGVSSPAGVTVAVKGN